MDTQIRLHSFLERSGKLPTLPGIAAQILAKTREESLDLNEIAEIVSCDHFLNGKILKMVNSAAYGLPTQIVSVRHALRYLGLSTVKNIVLGISIIDSFRKMEPKYFSYAQFWKDSLVGAAAAKLIAERIEKRHGESPFLMGLLQNIGILILVEAFPMTYDSVMEESLSGAMALHEAESLILNINHMEVGQYVVSAWGLPESFSFPIGNHHQPKKIAGNSPGIKTITRILHLSSLCIESFKNIKINEFHAELDNGIEKYGFSNFINSNTLLSEIVIQIKPLFPIFEIDATELESDYSLLFKKSKRSSKFTLVKR